MAHMSDDPVGYWNDDAGPHWVRVQSAIDRTLAPITTQLLDATEVQPCEHVVDVGCGSGTITLAMADRVGPTGHVLGVDVSEPLLRHARSRCSGIRQIALTKADAGKFRFDPGSADLVTSRFGVMFFPNPSEAFSNIGKALRHGGRLTFVCWQTLDRNPWLSFIMQAFPEIEPSLPSPDDGPGPFSLSSPDRIHEILSIAAFSDVRVDSFGTTLKLGDTVDQALAALTEVGPLARALGEAPEATRPTLVDRARGFLDEQYIDGPPALSAAAWIVRGSWLPGTAS